MLRQVGARPRACPAAGGNREGCPYLKFRTHPKEDTHVVSDETLTVQEVADYLKVSRTTVWRWCNQGLLPAFKIGRGWRVRRGELEKVMTQKREEVFGHNLLVAEEREITTTNR